MARNKYPEETINQILTVALNLFMQKGYEQTSIQDIINELGGLTKGLFTITSSRRKRSGRPSSIMRSKALTKCCPASGMTMG